MSDAAPPSGTEIPLPEPDRTGSIPLETTLADRRSRREFGPGPVSLEAVGQLLWAAQGQTHPDGLRTAPSAGATFPVVLRVVVQAGGVPELDAGIYRYRPAPHSLLLESTAEIHTDLQRAAYGQEWVGESPVILAITGIVERTAREYGDRAGDLYVPVEAGHVGQNIYLQAEALDLATVSVGGFEDRAVATALDLDAARPYVMYPVGPRETSSP